MLSLRAEPLFESVPVDKPVALRAWPLVQLSHPGMTREQWIAYAASGRRRNGKTAGLMAIRDGRGYIHAVFAWHVQRTLDNPRALRITDMVVGALPGRWLAETIVAAVQAIARRTNATSVLVEIGDRQIAPGALLSEGFEHLVMHCMQSSRPPEHA
ncbi:MAG: hypothetical protein JWN93_2235 [Hyphomicrobiales bacterium]|nr:hypothetical protein [Hyphomicrobiales bacterium]